MRLSSPFLWSLTLGPSSVLQNSLLWNRTHGSSTWLGVSTSTQMRLWLQLDAGTIGGAALDVVDPEPLPAGHRLWEFSNVIITPHTATTPAMGRPLLAARITENVRRWGASEPLEGVVEVDLGY